MSFWCCLRNQACSSPGEPTAEKLEFELYREQMINDFVANVSADAVKTVSEEQGVSSTSMQDDVFVDNEDEVTRDLSQMVSRFGKRQEADDSDDGIGEEHVVDFVTKQKISQVLDMGVYQPGINMKNQDSDESSEVESESGVSMTNSSKRSSRREANDAFLRNKSSGFNRFSTVSNPLQPMSKTSSVDNPARRLHRGVSVDNGGDPETQNIIDVIHEDAKALLQGMMDRAEAMSCEEISTNYLGNAL